MQHFFKTFGLAATLLLTAAAPALAGNPGRIGSAGATQLVINPWASSASWAGANMSSIGGVESMSFNPAGLMRNPGSEFMFSRSSWLTGTDIGINAFGYAQRLGGDSGANAFGVAITSFDIGEIEITRTDQPEGGLGTYSPQIMNLAVGYGHSFSQRISTGVSVRVISEGIQDARAQGVALDAGIQYTSGEHREFHFGIALRNIGPAMKYSGDGLSIRARLEGRPGEETQTVEQRSASFELPSLLNIAAGYDIGLDSARNHIISIMGSFVANSFDKNQIIVGAQYTLLNRLMLRAGFDYQQGIFSDERTTVFVGPAVGAGVQFPFGNNSKMLGFNYGFRATQPFGGTHTFGAMLRL